MNLKTPSLLLIAFLTVGASASQKPSEPSKEEKKLAKAEEERKQYRPASVTIRSTIEEIKAELIRQHLAEGYELATEQPSQLVFNSPRVNKQSNISRAIIGDFTTRMVQTFTFTLEGQIVTVFGAADVIGTNSAGVDERPLARFGPSKELKARMQEYLDKLKKKVEDPK